MLVSSFPSYTRGGPMPLAGAPRDLYTRLLACISTQSVVAMACCLRAILCFGFFLLAVSACTMTARRTNNSLAASLNGENTSSLEQRCLHFLAQGLAPSTRKAYASGQRKFVEFCRQAAKLHRNGSPCPADEWTLCLFVSFLVESIQYSSIKVYYQQFATCTLSKVFLTQCLIACGFNEC